MFNVYASDLKTSAAALQEHQSLQAVLQRKSSAFLREKLSSRYRARINHFMMAMLNDPLCVNEYRRPAEGAWREEAPDKFKGGAAFIVKGHKTERERIQERVERNRVLDLQPTAQRCDFRKRDSSKDINPRMYFQPRTSLDRVKAAVAHTNALNDSQTRSKSVTVTETDEDKSAPLSSEHAVTEPAYRRKVAKPREILPSLHRKTHFQAVNAIMSRSPQRSLVSPHVSAPTSREASLAPNIESVMKLGTFREEEAPYIAREVLVDCKVLPATRVNSYVKSGAGHLVSNPDTSVRKVYQRLRRTESVQKSARGVYGV